MTSKLQQCLATEVYAVQLLVCMRSVYRKKMKACVGPQLQVFQEQRYAMQHFCYDSENVSRGKQLTRPSRYRKRALPSTTFQ